ncbi:glycosyltransferase family 4 protein [Thermodesulfobacteriota bacterium]
MKISGIKYIAPFLDMTTYGVGSANCINAINAHTSIPLTIQEFSLEKGLFQEQSERNSWKPLIEKTIDYNVKIIHTPPPYYSKIKEPGITNIGFLYWETSLIPDSWVKEINKHLDAQFVCCQDTKKSLLDSGVKIPVIVIPPGFEFNHKPSKKQSPVFGLTKNTYKFYSIGQWTERKNLIGLLNAYLTGFTPEDKVLLVLKTYLNDYSPNNFEQIKQGIEMIKMSIRLNSKYKNHFPPIALISHFFSPEEMRSLHNECDCLALPHRGEGIGLVHAEAMSAGNPVISTALGGNTEFMDKNNSFLIPYSLTPVIGMLGIKEYESDMYWAEPDLYELKKVMRYAYENKKAVQKIGECAGKTIQSKFTTKVLAKNMINAIQKTLKNKK